MCGSFLLTPHIDTVFPEGSKFTRILYNKHDIADYASEDIYKLFNQNNQWMEEMLNEGRTILVHCAAGVSRSPSFVIAFLMWKKKMELQAAFDLVKSKRNVIRPNAGFMKQLQRY